VGLPYHLLLGARDWQPLIDAGGIDVAWDAERAQLTLRPELLRLPARASERPLTPEDRRGAAADRFGHLYWIDPPARAIRCRPAGSTASGELWSVEALGEGGAPACARFAGGGFHAVAEPGPTATRLRGLTVTTRGYLVAGTLAPAGLLVLDLHGSNPAAWHRWPETVPFAPFDLAADACGGLWILDLPEAPAMGAEPRLWYLDAELKLASPPGAVGMETTPARVDAFADQGGAPRLRPAQRHPQALPLQLAVPPASSTSVAIEALPDGTLLLLDQGPTRSGALLHRLDCGSAVGAPVDLAAAVGELLSVAPGLTGHDLAFVPAAAGEAGPAPHAVAGMLFVASAEGNQSFGFRLTATPSALAIAAVPRYLPMRRFAGKALVSGVGEAFYDQADGWLMLTELPRPRYAREGSLMVGGEVFDGKAPQTRWHRLFLDGCIPPGDALLIESRAADDPRELERLPWRAEPAPYLRRGNRHALPAAGGRDALPADEGERPFHRPFGATALAQQGVGTWELLLQQAVGRYLELRLRLTGSGRSSPRIRALRVYYPRLSYPERFLPDAYLEEPVSASFIERFLAIFEGVYSELEGRVAGVQTLFDGRTAPAEALEWLASWLGASLDEGWEESRRRLFIRHAVELYRGRGTVRGLVRVIRLAIDPCVDERLFAAGADTAPFGVRIVEHFARRTLPSGLPVGAAGTVLPAAVAATAPWTPSQGGARLHRLWRAFLQSAHAPGGSDDALRAALAAARGTPPAGVDTLLHFWSLTPADPAHAADRDAFLHRWLGLSYAELTADDAPLYRDYLARKHGSIAALNRAYGLTGSAAYAAFEAIALPPADGLPADGAPLADWFELATVDAVAARAAHRFSVLVPVSPEQSPSERQHLLERVQAVVERERPSHAGFDVQPYWALFRVGAARAGLDTVLGEGSRFTALVLDAGYLGTGVLGEHHPWNLADRWVAGRDGAGARTLGRPT
jgi:phage tail-like protein